MTRLAIGFLAGTILLLTSALVLSAPDSRSGPFVLDEGTFEEGCYEPCMCPIMSRNGLEGGFVLVSTGLVDGFSTFEVTDVVLKVGDPNGFEVRGSGTYRISSGDPAEHEMILDLTRGDEPAEHYSSGLVPAKDPQAIHIALSKNGFYCYDKAFFILASPKEHPISWGGIKSLFATD